MLLDFGLAVRLSGSAQSETVSVGTPSYMAPEQEDIEFGGYRWSGGLVCRRRHVV